MLKRIIKSQIFIPIMALLILTIFNLINDPSFFAIEFSYNSDGNPVLLGNLITILDMGSELAILAIGMTFVTAATGGQDISVGAAIAIAGSVIIRMVRGNELFPEKVHVPIILAFLVACVVVMICGAFNGVLVAYFKIQPMVATLILFTAGRSIAQWINENANCNIGDPDFKIIGSYIPGIPIPTPFLVAVLCMIVTAIIMKVTTIGLYTQSVGINENSSKLNGLNPFTIKMLAFILLGVCVGVVGLIKVSRIYGINYSSIAKDIEMDAILAVALGGNALSGGKFNMATSILGAYVIQYLTTTLYKMQVPSTALPAYKAVVVIILVVIGSNAVRNAFANLEKKLETKKMTKEVA